MKTAIVYYSNHHFNTERILEAIAKKYDVALIDTFDTDTADLSQYDMIGFASGIYYSKFHKSVLEFARKHLPQGKKVFFIYTCGMERKGYTDAVSKIAKEKNSVIVCEYGCLGYNTSGPFKLIGGMAKGHPDAMDIDKAIRFFGEINK